MSEERFIIVGTREGKDVFWAIDNQSGGYPWWTDSLFGAEKYLSIKKASSQMSFGGYMFEQATNIRVCKLIIEYETVSDASVLAALKEAALAKLTAEDKKILGLE